MGDMNQLSPLETVVAYFFAGTALLTLLLTSWAYVYQKRRQHMVVKEPHSENYGEFFVRR